MPAYSQVLFALEHSIEPLGFEALCLDLMVREGYSQIVPGGSTRDQGRDAEIRFWTGAHHERPIVAFQFSMERSWEKKLRTDATKIRSKCATVTSLVFVSSQTISVAKQDKLREELKTSLGLETTIFDKGWFRLRLEEQHQDLAQKHLNLTLPSTPDYFANQFLDFGINDGALEDLLRSTTPESVRATFAGQIARDSKNYLAWKGLAHLTFITRDYDEALRAVEEALDLNTDRLEEINLKGLKVAILAEKGIESKSRLLLVQARTLIEWFVAKLGRSVDHFNYANILGALEEPKEAEAHYRRSIDLCGDYAPAWKNLGSLLGRKGDHEAELECYEKALQIDPKLVEAHLSKAHSLAFVLRRFGDAVASFKEAFSLDLTIERKRRHAHYWLSMALHGAGRSREALAECSKGMRQRPDCTYLLRLKSGILSVLWREDPSFLKEAESFFRLRIASTEDDFNGLSEIIEILDQDGRAEEAWPIVQRALPFKENSLQKIAARAGVGIHAFGRAFADIESYRDYRGISDIGQIGKSVLEAGLRPHSEVANLFYVFLLVSFSGMRREVQHAQNFKTPGSNLGVIRECTRTMGSLLGSIGGAFLNVAKPDREAVAEAIVTGVEILPEIVLREGSRQWGYQAGFFQVAEPDLLACSIVEAYDGFRLNCIEKLLTAVYEDWDLPEKTAERVETSDPSKGE